MEGNLTKIAKEGSGGHGDCEYKNCNYKSNFFFFFLKKVRNTEIECLISKIGNRKLKYLLIYYKG